MRFQIMEALDPQTAREEVLELLPKLENIKMDQQPTNITTRWS